jgi:predicted nuclease of predicted toxin-antitoxin system
VRILLDESVPRGLRRFLPDHDVRTVAEQGWRSLRNSTLLQLAQESFDVLVTADQGFEHEQNLEQFDISVIILVAPSNRLVDYEPLTASLQDAVGTVRRGASLRLIAEQ